MNSNHNHSDHVAAEISAAGAERTDDHFFEALRTADLDTLDALLAQDFVLVDVFGGGTINRHDVINSVGTRQLVFDSIEPGERVTRPYGNITVIVGRTWMTGSFAGAPFEVASRYTHVLRRGDAELWQLVNAQGTRIADQPPAPPARKNA